MFRTDYAYLRRLTLLPRGTIVEPGQTIVSVEVAALGPIAVWPGTSEPHPTHVPALQIVSASDEPYTVAPGEFYSTEYHGSNCKPDPGRGCYGRFALVAPPDASAPLALSAQRGESEHDAERVRQGLSPLAPRRTGDTLP